jgi:carbon monoxide dehydrogenase subunit G
VPQIEYTVKIATPVERVWAFVEHLPNWAPLMVGYQKLEEVTDRQSVWTLKGDLGILAREVDLRADITTWKPNERVEFTLTGLTEALTGSGVFTLARAGAPGAQGDVSAPDDAAAPPAASRGPGGIRAWFIRLQQRVVRRAMKRAAGADEAVRAAATRLAPAGGQDGETSVLTFQLDLKPGGAMAPMLELLMAPMLEPAVIDLSEGIRAALEAS